MVKGENIPTWSLTILLSLKPKLNLNTQNWYCLRGFLILNILELNQTIDHLAVILILATTGHTSNCTVGHRLIVFRVFGMITATFTSRISTSGNDFDRRQGHILTSLID